MATKYVNDLKRKSTFAAIIFILGYYPIFISFELFFIVATIVGTIPLLIYPPYFRRLKFYIVNRLYQDC